MSAYASQNMPSFAADVAEGLSLSEKRLNPQYLYDEIGVSLFNTIQLLPEYGLNRAEQRLFKRHGAEITRLVGPLSMFRELGDQVSGMESPLARFFSRTATSEWKSFGIPGRRSDCQCSDWTARATQAIAGRSTNESALFVLSGASVGNVNRASLTNVFNQMRSVLRNNDHLLFTVDLVKDTAKVLAAYDDSAGVTAAFNKNLLSRINRELNGRFDPRSFDHTVKWNCFQRCVELHLQSTKDQEVYVGALGRRFPFRTNETIRTESFRKFSELEVEGLAKDAELRPVKTFIDIEWALAAVLWTV